MGLLGDLFDRFKKQPSLWDLKLDDLNRERITLQQEQHKLDMEADRLHKDEIQLKSEYAESQTPTQLVRSTPSATKVLGTSSRRSLGPDILLSGPSSSCKFPSASLAAYMVLARIRIFSFLNSVRRRSVETNPIRESTSRKTRLIKAKLNTRANPLLLPSLFISGLEALPHGKAKERRRVAWTGRASSSNQFA